MSKLRISREMTPDEVLVERARSGDDVALAELILRYRGHEFGALLCEAIRTYESGGDRLFVEHLTPGRLGQTSSDVSGQ